MENIYKSLYPDIKVKEQKPEAYDYVSEAFAEARIDGIEGENLAHAALFAAFVELVASHGEESVANFAQSIAEAIRIGKYSLRTKH